jgi:cyclopropane fatty-acyl-phospholipid synthase-like methyltransferase
VRPGPGVREYYDANTWKFLLTGGHRVLHRELWAPGVANRREALQHAHGLVLGELGQDDRRVLDLGCGVGTAGLYVARERPVDVVGVSISPEQVRLARRFAARGGPLPGSVRFEVADFTALPEHLTGFDLAFAIEAFVHADPASAFLREVAGALVPGGALVVLDDFRTGDQPDGRLDDVRAGWHVTSLLTVPDVAALAREADLALESSRDLSSLQRLGRPRDRFVHTAQPVLRRLRGRSLWAQSMVGGDALQACHRAGLLEYRLLRFRRRPE